jgi:CRP-like cAMP-binding protein
MATPKRNIARALKRVPLLRKLDALALDALARGALSIEVQRGMRLYSRGDANAGLYIVVSGNIVLSVDGAEGANKVLRIAGPSNHIGLASTILNAPHVTHADAMAASSLLLLSREALLARMAHDGESAMGLAVTLSQTVCRLLADIEALSLRSGRARLARYLLDIAAAEQTNGAKVTLPVKKGIIASRLNLTPEYFSRVLRDLSTSGAIAIDGRQIIIVDRKLLQESAER